MRADVPQVIDGDGHIFEPDEGICGYLEAKYSAATLKRFPLFPSLDRMARLGPGGKFGYDAAGWLQFLDDAEIESTVLYPTSALAFGFADGVEWCVDLARAYNDFVSDNYLRVSPRMKAVAVLPVQDPSAAAAELRRATQELGMVGGLLPAVGLRFPYGEEHFDALYREADALETMLAVHGAPHRDLGPFIEYYPQIGGFAHPVSLMIQFSSMANGRVFERFPRMKVAFLEGGCGWMPFAMERIDRQNQRSGRKLASEQVRDYPVYVHAELDEAALPYAVSVIGEDRFIFASDYPHQGPTSEPVAQEIDAFVRRADLSAAAKRKLLCDNVKTLYAMK